jgi:hypothetical protein
MANGTMNESGMQRAVRIDLYRGTYTRPGSHSMPLNACVVAGESGAQARDLDSTLAQLTV